MYEQSRVPLRCCNNAINQARPTITIVPRFLTPLVKEGEFPLGRQVWDDTHMVIPADAPTVWRENIASRFINGKHTVSIGDILRYFPVALLISERDK